MKQSSLELDVPQSLDFCVVEYLSFCLWGQADEVKTPTQPELQSNAKKVFARKHIRNNFTTCGRNGTSWKVIIPCKYDCKHQLAKVCTIQES